MKKIPNVISEFDVQGTFNDNNATNPLNVLVNHRAFAWSSPGNRKFVILSYTIKNTGNDLLDGLYAGIFAGWNVMDHTLNKADFDAGHKMGYVWSTENNGKYAGIKLLSNTTSVNHYVIDNVPGGNGGINITDGFSTQEKYISLSTNRTHAGINASPTDVISILSTGPFDVLPGDSAIVAFALIAGGSLEDLHTSAIAAQSKYDDKILPLAIGSLKQLNQLLAKQAYPNPAHDEITWEFTLAEATLIELWIYNKLGQDVFQLLDKHLDKGKHSIKIDASNFENGIYFYRLHAGDLSAKGKIVVKGK